MLAREGVIGPVVVLLLQYTVHECPVWNL